MVTTLVVVALGLLILGFPLFVTFLGTSLVVMHFYMDVSPLIIAQRLFGTIDVFALMAVPFFIFAANIMGQGGISKRLIDWVLAICGNIRGSLGVATIGAAEFFAALSGSSSATVAAIGKVLYPSLIENKYGERFSLALVTASGGISIVIPPSISLILFGVATNVSIGKLFMAGFLPGIVFGLCLIIYVLYYAHSRKIPVTNHHISFKDLWEKTKSAVWALGVPGIIMGGIYTGIFTPTEAAGISAVYAVLVVVFIYKELTWKEVLDIAIESGVLTAKINIIVAASGVFTWMLTVAQIPQQLSMAIIGLDASPIAVLLIINALLLFVGMFIDPTSAVLIMAPLLMPVVLGVGVDPVHFGIIMVVNLAIGMYTPPFGLNLFVSSGVFNVPMGRIVPGLIPFIGWSLVALMLVTYIPWISLWLPSLMW